MTKTTTVNISERFWAKVDRNGPIPRHRPDLGPCHVWKGGVRSKERPYGHIRFEGKRQKTHRLAFFLAHGRWPEPHCCHRCDNESCVNNEHLFEGTHADNMRDMATKGRHVTPGGEFHWSKTKPERVARGERAGVAKLTATEVLAIRAIYNTGAESQPALARKFGVSRRTVGLIVRGVSWSHVGGVSR